MSDPVFFFDASALVKRYALEIGAAWVAAVTKPDSENAIAIAQITLAEVTAALAGKFRGRIIAEVEFEQAIEDLLRDAFEVFTLVVIDEQVVRRAVALAQKYPLRGYDAVQLACGLTLNDAVVAAAENPLIFVTSDKALLTAAHAEGLQTEDPNSYP